MTISSIEIDTIFLRKNRIVLKINNKTTKNSNQFQHCPPTSHDDSIHADQSLKLTKRVV